MPNVFSQQRVSEAELLMIIDYYIPVSGLHKMTHHGMFHYLLKSTDLLMHQYFSNFSSQLKTFLKKSLCYPQGTLQYNTMDTAIAQQRRDGRRRRLQMKQRCVQITEMRKTKTNFFRNKVSKYDKTIPSA